jgi:outer membrane protein assembly factor BamB
VKLFGLISKKHVCACLQVPVNGGEKTKLILYCIIGWLLVSCTVGEDTDDWPMFMHDPQHTGYSTSSVPVCPEKVWKYSKYPDSQDHDHFVDLIVSEGMLIAVQQNSSVFALDTEDGSLLWETSDNNISLHTPAAAQGRIYVGMYEGILCLDIYTGEILWKYEDRHVRFLSDPIVIGEYIVIGSWDALFDYFGPDQDTIVTEAKRKMRRVLCLNTQTGDVVWEFYAQGTIGEISPTYLDGKIYVNDLGGRLYCLNAATGEVIWENDMEGSSGSSLSLNEERIFVGTRKGVLNCHSRKTGEILWKFACGEKISATPALAYDRVFIGSQNGIFYCLDDQTGELIWNVETGSKIYSTDFLADKKLGFVTEDMNLYILDAFSGEVIYRHRLKDDIFSLVLSDGRLFLGESNGGITCFQQGSCSRGLIQAALIIVIAGSCVAWNWYRRVKKKKEI